MSCDDDYDDEYSSEDEIFYHNYSVDYAKQLLGGQHGISSCLPLMRRKHHRRSPRLVRVATLDQMPIVNRHLSSRSKYRNEENILFPSLPPRLPSLEATNDELERRAARGTEPTSQETSNNGFQSDDQNPSSQNAYRPMTETELMQVQQQQAAFQQHLLNMQRHLVEQQQQQEYQGPASSHRIEKRTKKSYHDLELDDDQAEIAQLIETDPYFAAAMEDFAHTHGLLPGGRHRTHSGYSSSRHSQYSRHSRHSQHSQHLCERHRHEHNHRPPSSVSPSSSSSSSSLTNVSQELKGSNSDLLLFRELHGIRRLMKEFIREGRNNTNQPTISILPVPWPMGGGQFPMNTTGGHFPTTSGVHYPPVATDTDYQPPIVPRQRDQPPEPKRVIYQNVVNAMKEVIGRRSPSQRDEPLKPSQIDPKLKHVYTRPPRIPTSNTRPLAMQRPPLPNQQQQRRRSSQLTTPPLQHQQQRRRSSQLTTPPIVRIPSVSSNNNPPYGTLSNFSSSRPTLNDSRNLSYGNREKQSNIYDTLVPGNYFRLYNK